MGFVEVHHCLSLNDCCSRLSCRSLVTGICHLLAEAVSKRIKKSFVTIISPHVYEKTVSF
jgi:hypothetical protein